MQLAELSKVDASSIIANADMCVSDVQQLCNLQDEVRV
jgi:hypothetical protein